MDSTINIRWIMSLMLMFFFASGYAQDEEKTSIGEVVYEEYQENGIDEAISKYKDLKANQADDYTWNEWELNNIGYQIMNDDNDLEAAEKIFSLNIEEYPKAANPYDSYADYLLEKGDTEKAKEYLKKSIAIAEKSNIEDEQTRILSASKGKLARLEKKDKQLDFLVGDWNIDATGYQEGKEANKMKGKDKVVYDENANAIIFHHFDDQQQSEGMRILAYDAVDDEFDVAYLSPSSLQGIQMSSMKMKNVGENKYEFMDHYTTRNGKEMMMKHEMQRISDNEIKWVIFEKTDQGEWQKVYAMNMTK
ncbi:tetratricopeptide repeat protein [Salinimicrobium catena]|uniref:tetratricopeptide repeat protein n=1 Tax=Salinimicrobium catena TaxID=390640 RepID=UPI002FE4B99B